MREIKFRVFKKTDNNFGGIRSLKFKINEANFENVKSIISELDYANIRASDFHDIIYNLDEIELNQFTGLKDCKEREIYENDIVKTKIGVMDFVLKVVFENGKFMAVCDDDDLTAFDLFTIADKCEVIGNIYENSELLK